MGRFLGGSPRCLGCSATFLLPIRWYHVSLVESGPPHTFRPSVLKASNNMNLGGLGTARYVSLALFSHDC